VGGEADHKQLVGLPKNRGQEVLKKWGQSTAGC